jgi:hypothetical protein
LQMITKKQLVASALIPDDRRAVRGKIMHR